MPRRGLNIKMKNSPWKKNNKPDATKAKIVQVHNNFFLSNLLLNELPTIADITAEK